MKLGKVIIAGFTAAVLSIIIGMLTCGGAFSWVYQLEPTNVWKPMNEIIMPLYMGGMVLINIIFAFVYALLSRAIEGSKIKKGAIFGLCVFAVGMIPGMFATYMFMTVAPTVIIYWLVWDVIVLPLKSVVIAAIYED